MEMKNNKPLPSYNDLDIEAKFRHCKKKYFETIQGKSRILIVTLIEIISRVKRETKKKGVGL